LDRSLSNPDAIPGRQTPIELSGERWDEFIERWLIWFAKAANGTLQYPDKIPDM
jgi:hypothetical protein